MPPSIMLHSLLQETGDNRTTYCEHKVKVFIENPETNSSKTHQKEVKKDRKKKHHAT